LAPFGRQVRALENEPDRPQERADSAEEEHQRRGAIRALPRRFAEDHESQKETQQPHEEVEGGDRQGVHERSIRYLRRRLVREQSRRSQEKRLARCERMSPSALSS